MGNIDVECEVRVLIHEQFLICQLEEDPCDFFKIAWSYTVNVEPEDVELLNSYFCIVGPI